ncbi:MAG: hypothetical protein RL562_1433 [Planctomycetota bacterium]
MKPRIGLSVLTGLVCAVHASPQRGVVQGRAVGAETASAPQDLTVADLRTGQLARVAPDGGFQIEVDDLATARLRIAARGRATAEVRVVGRTGLGTIVLPRGATVTGTVTDTRGRRVASVPVRIVDALADLPFFPTLDDPPLVYVARTTTRADGSFAVAGALPSAGRLVIAQMGGGETVFEPAEAGVPIDIRIPAVRPGVVRAVDRSGEGVPGVQVYVVDADGRRASIGTTDTHGVLLGQLPEGPGLSAVGEMVLGAVRVATLPATLPATGLALDVVLRLQDSDLVATELRAPVERFTVQAWYGEEPARGLLFRSAERGRTADQGVVHLPPATRGTPFLALIRAPGRARTTLRGVAGGSEPVAFTMEREATVRGQVLDAVSGEPVAGVGILWVEPDALARALELPIEVVTDDAGEFLLEGIPAGRGYVVARPAGGGRLATASIAVRAGERVDRLALRVDRGRLARGIVAHAPPDASVELLDDGGWRAEAELDEDGGFRCADAPFRATQVSLVIPSPVRLGAPRIAVLGNLDDDLDSEGTAQFDASDCVRSVRGRVDLGAMALPRDRLAIFVEPLDVEGAGDPRHSLWFEGARAWIGRGGSFEVVVLRAPSMVCVVDVATGVVLERVDRVEVESGDGPLDLGVLRVDVRRVSVEVDASIRDRARRIDVDLGSLYPGGVGRMAMPSPITQLWERGTGLPLAAGRTGVDLLLPAVEVEVRARSDRFGTPGDNIVARRRGTPVDGAVWVLEPVR